MADGHNSSDAGSGVDDPVVALVTRPHSLDAKPAEHADQVKSLTELVTLMRERLKERLRGLRQASGLGWRQPTRLRSSDASHVGGCG